MGTRSQYFETSLVSIEHIQKAPDADKLVEAFSNALANFGYEYFCIVATPAAQKQKFGEKLLLKKWPQPWYQQYAESSLHFHDPVSAYSRKQVHSFPWSIVDVPKDDRLANDVMSISSHDYKMVQGFCVPIIGLNGHQATISLAGRDVDQHSEANAAVDIISIFAFNRLLNIRSEAGRPKLLTERESEVIKWTAAGKTAWDISVILSIAEDTVNKTARSAMRKLNVHTRAHAATEAIRLGEVQF